MYLTFQCDCRHGMRLSWPLRWTLSPGAWELPSRYDASLLNCSISSVSAFVPKTWLAMRRWARFVLSPGIAKHHACPAVKDPTISSDAHASGHELFSISLRTKAMVGIAMLGSIRIALGDSGAWCILGCQGSNNTLRYPCVWSWVACIFFRHPPVCLISECASIMTCNLCSARA